MLNSIILRIVILLLGCMLLFFYGILMVAAVVNLPDSWFGFLYSLGGIIAGILCFIYLLNKNKVLLIIALPFIILMIITLLK